MKYSKNYNFGIGFSKIGANAYKGNKVWKLGFHIFKTSDDLIFRICFFRNKKCTYYWQVSKTIKKQYSCIG